MERVGAPGEANGSAGAPAQGHSVLRVALELGYGSHSAFSAMFRRVMGVAPATIFVPGLIGGAERIAQRLQRGARHVIIDTHAPVAFSLRKTQRI